MARVDLTATTVPGGYATAMVAVTWNAGDATNGHRFVPSGKDLLLFKNSNVAAKIATLKAAPDECNRSVDLAQSIAPSAEMVFGPLNLLGWRQNDGYVNIDVEHTNISIAVVRL